MSPLTSITARLGQRVTAPGGIGGQCVDWANVFLSDTRGIPPVRANAVDWAGLAVAGLAWEANGPVNMPPLGALVVWHEWAPLGIGPYGHIAVCVAADEMHLITADQNWGGELVRLVVHSYAGVAGWQK